MRVEIEVRHVGEEETWKEQYEREIEDPEAWGRALIEWFNKGQRPGQLSREFVSAREIAEAPQEHVWEKANLVTETDRLGRMFDRARCTRCGVTGRRYGLSGAVTRDREFVAASYARCDLAMKLIEKKQAREAAK
jgi:hypothetical protein